LNIQVVDEPDGVDCILFVTSGRLDVLEFATRTGGWPTDPKITDIGYYRFVPHTPKGSGFTAVPVDQRDSDTLAFMLAGEWGMHAS
jgi:hypothetical protein